MAEFDKVGLWDRQLPEIPFPTLDFGPWTLDFGLYSRRNTRTRSRPSRPLKAASGT